MVKKVTADLVEAHDFATAAEWERAIRALWDGARFREERYVAVGIARARRFRNHRTPRALPLYEKLITEGAWWDFVDEISINLVGELVTNYAAKLKPVMRRWAKRDDIWLRRSAILCQLKAKANTDLRLLEAAIAPSMAEREFFLRKGIGWALREYSKTDPAWVIDYVTKHRDRLSPLSKREALKVLLKKGLIDAVPPGSSGADQ